LENDRSENKIDIITGIHPVKNEAPEKHCHAKNFQIACPTFRPVTLNSFHDLIPILIHILQTG
jgi:hypothetical protein